MNRVVTRKPLLSALAIATTLLMLQGCFTPLVYSRWKHSSDIPALTLRLQSAGPSSVQLEWEPETTEIPLPGGTLEFDPKLEHCSAVSVIATDGGKMQILEPGVPRTLRTYMNQELRTLWWDVDRVRSLWRRLDEVECKVLFVVASAGHPKISPVVYASTAKGEPSMATIPTRRNPHWLQLMPLALLADATIVAPIAGAAVCLMEPEKNPCLYFGLAALSAWFDFEY